MGPNNLTTTQHRIGRLRSQFHLPGTSLSIYLPIYMCVCVCFHFSLSALVSFSLSSASPNDSIFFSLWSFQFVLKPITPFLFLGLCSLSLKTETPIFFFFGLGLCSLSQNSQMNWMRKMMRVTNLVVTMMMVLCLMRLMIIYFRIALHCLW